MSFLPNAGHLLPNAVGPLPNLHAKKAYHSVRAKSYAHMLMKWTPGVNFTNILLAIFYTKMFFAAFIYLRFGFVFFGKRIL
jgi:hypothetical protein